MMDRDFILSLVPRLMEFGPPAWRDIPQMITVDNQVLIDKLTNPSTDAIFFLAEDEHGTPLGFIHIQPGTDYYNHESHAHIANVIMAPEAEGRGIGRMLMEKAEEWARAQGYRWLTLSVFADNTHAREVYKRLGFGEDIMKYVKELP
jgi:ribosomal protein S18 acetylase RimI-like enzyme